MTNHEGLIAGMLGLTTLAFLGGFWFLPDGVLALRRRAQGEMQVDVRPGYGPDTLYRLLQLYGPDGVRAFRRMLVADMVFPAAYGALFYLLGDLSAAAHPSALRAGGVVRAVGVAAAGFDYIENLLLFRVLQSQPRQNRLTARAAGAATTLKVIGFIGALSRTHAVGRVASRRSGGTFQCASTAPHTRRVCVGFPPLKSARRLASLLRLQLHESG